MRMPLSEFITSGDLKFIIVFIIFTSIAVYRFIKKLQAKNKAESQELTIYYNAKINSAATWILIASVLSLFLGLLHSFYFIGKAGGIAPNLIFQGASYALITPVFGICLYIVCKIFSETFNSKTIKS
jgi:biopolymer transport protein ExbB/TolQ